MMEDLDKAEITKYDENYLHDKKQIEFLSLMGFIYGSIDINYIKKGDAYKKQLIYKKKWKTQIKSFYDPSCNGVYVKTGKISNCFVIDIDDFNKEETNIIMEMCNDNCALICKTKRGFHYYFLYDDNILNGQYQEFGFDIRSDGGLINCPPSYYKNENNEIIKYKYIISPKNNKLTKLTDNLKSYLLKLISIHNGHGEHNKKEKNSNSVIRKIIKDPVLNDIYTLDTKYVDDILKNNISFKKNLANALFDCISNLDPKRNNNYESWFKLGCALSKFGSYGVSLWKQFSKQYSNYDENEINLKIKTFNDEIGPKLGSLLYWLKIDNKLFYDEYCQKYKELLNHINANKDIEIVELEINYNNDDLGYITLYHDKFKDDLVYCNEINNYYLFNYVTKLWDEITTDEVICHFMTKMKLIITPLIEHYKTISNSSNDKEIRKKFEKLASKVEHTPEFCKSSKALTMIPLIRSYFRDKQFANKINNIPDMIPVKNGVVNLRTGEFRERYKFDYFTFELNINWKGLDYSTIDIKKFIDDIMLDNENMVNYLQKLLGYSITGYTNLQKFVILWGNGGNGKGILQNLLMSLMGNYYRQVSNDVIIESGKGSNPNSASPHLMHLLGARLAFVDESGLGAKLNETFVKNVTGGSNINARPLYGKMITFKPTFHLFLLTNNKPEINVDDSTKRRVILIPFLAEFREASDCNKNNPRHKQKNDNIEALLMSNLDQLLTWIVQGSIKYFNEGLGELPKEIINATNEYMNENDELGNFLNNVCDKCENGYVYHSSLFDKFKKQTDSNISSKVFTQMMKTKGYLQSRKKDGTIFNGLIFKINNNELDI